MAAYRAGAIGVSALGELLGSLSRSAADDRSTGSSPAVESVVTSDDWGVRIQRRFRELRVYASERAADARGPARKAEVSGNT